LDDLARHLGLSTRPVTAPFQPETGAYHGGHGHQH
ncbi:MAG: urease accessory protein UreE, partial [Opitutae bacterium]|nr:urease accessory protein UreE [Opitutae bacterium]